MIEKPADLSAHNFKPCDTHGGSAFRSWYMLMKHKGIFIGFHNHDWIVMASSDPNAKWYRGCQESCAYGDPSPQSQTAKWIPISELPYEAQTLAIKWVYEAIEIARAKIKEHENQEKERKERENLQRQSEYKKTIADPWMQAVNNPPGE